MSAATLALWIRSEFFFDQTLWSSRKVKFTLASSNGQFVVTIDRLLPASSGSFGPMWSSHYGWQGLRSQRGAMTWGIEPNPVLAKLGIWIWSSTIVPNSGNQLIIISSPYWLMTSLTAAIALVAHRDYKKRRAAMGLRGLCEKCGYDLRATPDRCPECGTLAGTPVVQV